MKPSSRGLPSIIALFFTLVMSVPQHAQTSEANVTTPKTPASETAIPTSSALMRAAYLALVKDSIVPARPQVIAEAAFDAIKSIAPERVLPLPSWFGTDPERDATWLAERVVDFPDSWSVIDAMVRSADNAHVGFGTPQRRQGMAALGHGEPLSSPGFNVYPLANGRFVVFDIVNGASAHASGLRPGDVLLSVNGKRAVAADVFLLTMLPAGTEVPLTIERENRTETLTLGLIKAEVSPVESRLLDDGLGYIFIRWFSRSTNPDRDTAALARQAIAGFVEKGARGLILDLRSTLGGMGDVPLASALSDGEIIYSIQKPLSAPAKPVKRQGQRAWSGGPIVILVNQNTVSAPEALALALRELTHAKIIGQTSRGGLTEFSILPLAAGYGITIPTGVVLGPVTGAVPPTYALKPDLEIANPSTDDLQHGRDSQLDAARAAIPR
jgi:C-terminal processing protease CtpA/Prc